MIPYSDWLIGHDVPLEEILWGREQRALRQQEMIARGGTLLCFTMNIAGPIKAFALSEELFRIGDKRIRAAFSRSGLALLEREILELPWGWEGYYRLNGMPSDVKRTVLLVEEKTPEGRLFDFDVIDQTGDKVSREELGLPPRPCLICGTMGAGCASRRIHTLAQLQEKTVSLMMEAVRRDSPSPELIGALCRTALLHEVYTTPKPGLVDRANNGAHRDMDIPMFEDSAQALTLCFAELFQLGAELKTYSPDAVLPLLRKRGIQGEQEMLRATGGVNTHKGAVFSVGLLCAALGHLLAKGQGVPSLDRLLQHAGDIAEPALEQDLVSLERQKVRTAGERQYIERGLSGIRGEAASGFCSVRSFSWPTLLRGLQDGQSLEQAGVQALMELIAHVYDSNVIARGGMERGEQLRHMVQTYGMEHPVYETAWVEELDQMLIQWNVSPGGCADLLSVTYFLALLAELGLILP